MNASKLQQMSHMIILGIDPGLAHTGWGIIERRGNESRCMAYGCIKTQPQQELPQRLNHIYQELIAAVNKYQPNYVAVEQIYFGANSKSAMLTAQARGAALVACSGCGLTIGEFTPMQVKQVVVGTGAADKHQVQFMVQKLLKLDHTPKPDHCADALAVAYAYGQTYAFNASLSRIECA